MDRRIVTSLPTRFRSVSIEQIRSFFLAEKGNLPRVSLVQTYTHQSDRSIRNNRWAMIKSYTYVYRTYLYPDRSIGTTIFFENEIIKIKEEEEEEEDQEILRFIRLRFRWICFFFYPRETVQ